MTKNTKAISNCNVDETSESEDEDNVSGKHFGALNVDRRDRSRRLPQQFHYFRTNAAPHVRIRFKVRRLAVDNGGEG